MDWLLRVSARNLVHPLRNYSGFSGHRDLGGAAVLPRGKRFVPPR